MMSSLYDVATAHNDPEYLEQERVQETSGTNKPYERPTLRDIGSTQTSLVTLDLPVTNTKIAHNQPVYDQLPYTPSYFQTTTSTAKAIQEETAYTNNLSTPFPIKTKLSPAALAKRVPTRRVVRLNNEEGPVFGNTTQLCKLYNIDKSASYMATINARIDKGFFMNGTDWTCYRRNYFQVSASFIATNKQSEIITTPCLIDVAGRGLLTVVEFQIGIMCRTSNGTKEIDLVQHTVKRDRGPQMVPQPQPIQPTINNGTDYDDDTLVLFERVQFKAATANNGKRRAAQQYHVVYCELLARCTDGCIARVASCESTPVVVRGRAPGHYAGTKGTRKTSTKSNQDYDANALSANIGGSFMNDDPGEISLPENRHNQHGVREYGSYSIPTTTAPFYYQQYNPTIWGAQKDNGGGNDHF